ncbi:MAG: hypothetical protein ABW073_06840 [Acidimicrobiia bacterium]
MDRHDLNPVALVIGAAFTVFGLAYLIGGWSWFDAESGWLLGAFLVALGAAGIFSALRRPRATTPNAGD